MLDKEKLAVNKLNTQRLNSEITVIKIEPLLKLKQEFLQLHDHL